MMKKASELVEDMIAYKESIGRKRKTYACHLTNLAKYLDNKGISGEQISIKNDILPWCERRTGESSSGLHRRMDAARAFTQYLFALDLCDGILPLDEIPSHPRYKPYIFSDDELIRFFDTCDARNINFGGPLTSEIVAVVFRVIYFCGLRPNEGRELRRDDFNQDNNTLFIRHNKAGRERIIPIAEELADLLRSYLVKRDALYACSEYMFPAPDGSLASAKWLARRFNLVWEKTFPGEKRTARIYDLRHRYATTILTEWLDRGEDFYTALPYLSAYMGHNDFSSTAYYIHLLPERLLNSAGIDWKRFESLFPEVESYE